MNAVPEIRMRTCNDAPPNPAGDYVLYWMIASRRTNWNFALDRAIEWAQQLRKPLLVFEPLRSGFQWELERTRNFIIDGMRDNERALRNAAGVTYLPYIEPAHSSAKGLLHT